MLGLRVLFLFVGAVIASPSWSQAILPPLTNPQIVPNPARAGEPVVVRFRADGCTSFSGASEIDVQGSVITLTNQVDLLCGVPPPDYDFDIELGVFRPGSFTLVYAPTSAFGLSYLQQSVPFQVVPASIPASSWWAASILVLALVCLGGWQLTVRSSRRVRRGLT